MQRCTAPSSKLDSGATRLEVATTRNQWNPLVAMTFVAAASLSV
jgi:hypothetical protein